MSLGDLLAALPQRHVVESLVSTYTDSKAPSLSMSPFIKSNLERYNLFPQLTTNLQTLSTVLL